MTVQFTKPNYGETNSSFEKPTFYKLGHKTDADRTVICRIAPSMDGTDQGYCRYIKTHFGYTLPFSRKDGTSGTFAATFLCVEQRDRDGTITSTCPECEEINRRKDALDVKTAKLEKLGNDQAQIDTATVLDKKWLKDHNCDRKMNYFAKSAQDNKWGYLAVSYTCHKRLKSLLERTLKTKGIDGTDPDKGIWLRFFREGSKFNEIEDYVEAVQEELPDGSSRLKFDTITEKEREVLGKMMPLAELGKSLTADQIRLIVQSGGEESVIRTVMAIPNRSKRSDAAPAKAASGEDEEVSPDPVSSPVSGTPVLTEAQILDAEDSDPDISKLEAVLAAARAKLEAQKAAKTKAPVKAAAVLGQGGKPEMPMDEFLAMFEQK